MASSHSSVAVIATGGKQYLVTPGQKIKVEKLPNAVGDTIVFDHVLLQTKGDTLNLGQPFITGATVKAKVVEQGRHEKVTGVKFKAKKRYMRIFGHKQHFTEIEITEI